MKKVQCEICGEYVPQSDMSKSYRHRCKKCVAELTRQSRHDAKMRLAATEESDTHTADPATPYGCPVSDILQQICTNGTDETIRFAIQTYGKDAQTLMLFEEMAELQDAICKHSRGRDSWVNKVKRYGYNYDFRIMNAADYGAYTSRKRFFGIFAKHGLPIVFPEPTHSKTGGTDLFGETKKWKPVRDVLDFEDEGKSIFNRKKPLSENTLKRIYAGLIKFVAGGNSAFMVKYNSVNKKTGKYVPPSLDEPCPTVATQSRLALASVSFLSKQFGGAPEGKNISVEEPAGTITTIDHHAFISVHYGNGFNTSCDSPAATLTTKDRMALVSCHFMANEYSGGGQVTSIEQPNPAVLTNPKQKLVSCKRFLMNPQFTSKGGSVDAPCFTLIAGMDKMPPYLVTTKAGEVAIAIYETDSPMTVKIKEFMALYNIIDITMRMLKETELKLIMGFPEDYVLIGTQADKKKFIGNAVEVNMARSWCEALCAEIEKHHHKNVA